MKGINRTSLSKTGFTIVELLIVIVVIAILATISIIAYNGIQQRARESRVVTQLTQLRKEMEMHKIEYGDWSFREEMNEYLSEHPDMNEASAWCSAARHYISRNAADSGAGPWNSMSCAGNQSWACVGFLVKHSNSVSDDTGRMIYISREKVGVSPPGDNDAAMDWCADV